MSWGSLFASTVQSARAAVADKAQKAAQTAQTAWEHTKQKTQSLVEAGQNWAEQKYDALEDKAKAAAEWSQDQYAAGKQKAAEAADWSGEKVDAGKKWAADTKKATIDAYDKGKAWTVDTAKRTSQAVNEAYDAIENSFTPDTVGSAGCNCPKSTPAPLPPPARSSGPREKQPPCLIERVSVKCGHKERGFVLIPPDTATNEAKQQIIQVIADKNEHENITVSFSCGTCPRGNGPDLPHLRLGEQKTKSTETFILKGPVSPRMPGQAGDGFVYIPFSEFLTHFMVTRSYSDYISYHGSIACCSSVGNQDFEVQVFPKRSWNLDFSASCKIKKKTATQPKDSIELSATGKASTTYGVRKVEVNFPTFENVNRFLRVWGSSVLTFTESHYVKITPEWPSLKLAGKAEATEVKGRYDVSWKGEATLGFDPLFGLKGRFDALQWLIDVACYIYLPAIAPMVSRQIKYIRDKAEKGHGSEYGGFKAVARVDITATGKIGGTFNYKWLPGQDNVCSGELGGDIFDITVEGKVSAELRVLRVSYEAGASISGSSGFKGKITAEFFDDKPGWDGSLELKGLIIKGMAYQSLGGSSTGLQNEGQAPIQDRKRKKSWWKFWEENDDSLRFKDQADWQMVILEPYELWKGGTAGKGSGTELKDGL